VHFDASGPVETPVFERDSLLPGQRIRGPAIIEQLDATTVVGAADAVRVDAASNLLLEVAPP
jgi:N-methylhydantoinase A